MADDITIPQAPALTDIPGVELAQAGQWQLSSGTAVITREDLAAAVGAVDCPAVRNPVLKLGHIDPRFDGEPAVGWVGNMALTEEGTTLTGDYRGVPTWLADVIASAYPDRSIEATMGYVCQIGHTHRMVITAVALLGVAAPGIGTLTSLQDVAALYQVTATSDGGEPVTITIRGGPMPPPPAVEVAAGVTSEDVRRRYYETADYSMWITEMQLDPLQLIVMDDSAGKHYRVPIELDGGELSFGEPVEVAVEYVDRKVEAAAGAIVFASRAESRPDITATDTPPDAPPSDPEPDDQPNGDPGEQPDEDTPANKPAPPQTPVTNPVSGPTTKESTDMEFSDEQLAALRAKLGLPEDAALDPTTLVEQVEKLAASSGDGSPGTTRKNAPGTVVIDQQVYDDMQNRIKRLEEIRASQQKNERERAVDEAIRAGKFPPSRREHWLRVFEADPEGTTQLLAGLTPGTVPVDDLGTPGGDGPEIDAEFASLFPPQRKV